jgi:putative spermidine/putrescine transport system permease protein
MIVILPVYKLRREVLKGVFLLAAFAILLGPIATVIWASFGDYAGSTVIFPPRNFSTIYYQTIPSRYWQSLGLTVALASATTVFACLIAIPAAFGIVRGTMPGKALVMAIFRAPLQIPAVVSGVAFLQMYYFLNQSVGWFGVGTFLGLLIAHLFATTPYVIGTVVSVLQRFDASVEEAAAILGATRMATLWQVTLPILRPGIFAGALYAFMISFCEVPMSVFLTGSRLVTFPVEIFNSIQFDFQPPILAISSIVAVASLFMVWMVQRLIGLEMFLKAGTAE